ncbi:MAG: hypothetical protein KF791_05795 [Verrucomicrobiae bacterium]|nr:hypothetical protein [Verrucomicrobiae bacterium]
MTKDQLSPESLNDRPIRFILDDEGRSGVIHAFRTTGAVRITILAEFLVAPNRVRHAFVLLQPCQWEKIEPDPESKDGLVLRERLRSPATASCV